MTDAKEMFEFTIFLGVFYFLYFIIVSGEVLLEESGTEFFTSLVNTFFVPFKNLEGMWRYLNLLIFLPIYVFLLFTAIELANKTKVGSYAVLVVLVFLFGVTFFGIFFPHGLEGVEEVGKSFYEKSPIPTVVNVVENIVTHPEEIPAKAKEVIVNIPEFAKSAYEKSPISTLVDAITDLF